MEDNPKLKTIIEDLLKELGANLDDPNFKDTPTRVSKMFKHFFRNDSEREVEAIMSKIFPSKNDQMVIVKDIESFGMCPHHLVPIVYNIAIGYVPSGLVIGLSKLARLAISLSSFPKLQEDYTREIADTMEKHLKPKGVMVVVNGLHGCMRCRGVEMDAKTITSDVRGLFRYKESPRLEFMNLIK